MTVACCLYLQMCSVYVCVFVLQRLEGSERDAGAQ